MTTSPSFQSVQRGVKRAVLHLEKIIRGPLNMLADLVTVSRTIKKGFLQDQHVRGALEERFARSGVCLVMEDIRLSIGQNGRHSTISSQEMTCPLMAAVGRQRFPCLRSQVMAKLLGCNSKIW